MNTEALQQEIEYIALKAGEAVDHAVAGERFEQEEALQAVYQALEAIQEITGLIDDTEEE